MNLKLHSTVTVWTKWQIVIPRDVRERLGIRPKDSLMVITRDDKAIWMIKAGDLGEFMQYLEGEYAQEAADTDRRA